MLLAVCCASLADAWCMKIPGENTILGSGVAGNSEKEDLTREIAAIALNRDRQAFSRLFLILAPRIKAFCLKRGASAVEAEETAQETMIQVWRRAGQFDAQRASVTTWIFTIARNKRIDHFRKEQHPEITAEDLVQHSPYSPDVESQFELAEAGESLAEKLRALPREQAAVIHKAFFEDKTHQVIAKELNLALGTVKSRIRLALAKLRSSMSENE